MTRFFLLRHFVFVSPRIFHFLIVSDRRENFSQSESAIGLSPPTEKAHHLLQAWHRRGRTPILPLAQGRTADTQAHSATPLTRTLFFFLCKGGDAGTPRPGQTCFGHFALRSFDYWTPTNPHQIKNLQGLRIFYFSASEPSAILSIF